MKTIRGKAQQGFSLIEMILVIAILTIVLGVVLRQITVMQMRSKSESSKLDMNQQARESLDQMIHDLHMAGYPNAKMYGSSALVSPIENDTHVAAGCNPTTGNCVGVTTGLIKITNGNGSSTYPEIIIQGDVDNDGQVDSVQYKYVTSSSESTQCPCIMRSQKVKISAAPLSQNTDPHVLVENVNSLTFTAYAYNGVQVSIPSTGLDMTSNWTTIGTIKTIGITMSVKTATVDIQTKQNDSSVFTGLAQLRN